MDTDRNTVEKYFSGYIELSEDNGYLHLYRFGKEQRMFYEREGAFYGTQSRCQAGIKLAAENCTRVTFDFECEDESCESVKFGVISSAGRDEDFIFDTSPGKAEFCFNGEDIKIYFPYNMNVGIKNIKVCGEETEKSEKNILCLGDSITQGCFAQSPAWSYTAILDRAFGADVYNFGVGGYFIRPGILNEIDSLPEPWIITFAYGTNDWHFENDYKDNLDDIFKRLKNKFLGTPIFVILPSDRKGGEEQHKSGCLEDVREDLRQAAARFGFSVIEKSNKFSIKEHTAADGLHPNDSGMKMIADNIIDKIKETPT